jgi:hypothetical protein
MLAVHSIEPSTSSSSTRSRKLEEVVGFRLFVEGDDDGCDVLL